MRNSLYACLLLISSYPIYRWRAKYSENPTSAVRPPKIASNVNAKVGKRGHATLSAIYAGGRGQDIPPSGIPGASEMLTESTPAGEVLMDRGRVAGFVFCYLKSEELLNGG
jgi:hypothetical protein